MNIVSRFLNWCWGADDLTAKYGDPIELARSRAALRLATERLTALPSMVLAPSSFEYRGCDILETSTHSMDELVASLYGLDAVGYESDFGMSTEDRYDLALANEALKEYESDMAVSSSLTNLAAMRVAPNPIDPTCEENALFCHDEPMLEQGDIDRVLDAYAPVPHDPDDPGWITSYMRGGSSVAEQGLPKPRAGGSIPSSPAIPSGMKMMQDRDNTREERIREWNAAVDEARRVDRLRVTEEYFSGVKDGVIPKDLERIRRLRWEQTNNRPYPSPEELMQEAREEALRLFEWPK